MHDARTTPDTRRLRLQRREDALVAQYIHELSDRHARARDGTTAFAGHPGTGGGAHHAAESQGT
jgi:hypothetical protein